VGGVAPGVAAADCWLTRVAQDEGRRWAAGRRGGSVGAADDAAGDSGPRRGCCAGAGPAALPHLRRSGRRGLTAAALDDLLGPRAAACAGCAASAGRCQKPCRCAPAAAAPPEPAPPPASLLLFLLPHGWWLTAAAVSLPPHVLPYTPDALELLAAFDQGRLPAALHDALLEGDAAVFVRGRVAIEVRDYLGGHVPDCRVLVLQPDPVVRGGGGVPCRVPRPPAAPAASHAWLTRPLRCPDAWLL
jgi:hypothetical protein